MEDGSIGSSTIDFGRWNNVSRSTINRQEGEGTRKQKRISENRKFQFGWMKQVKPLETTLNAMGSIRRRNVSLW